MAEKPSAPAARCAWVRRREPAMMVQPEDTLDGLVVDAVERPVASSWRLPTQPTELLGREETLATICEALLRPECHLLTLLGVGGIGKTRLALAAASQLANDFDAGVCLVDL